MQLLLLALLAQTCTSSTDLYVDPASGSNSAAGTTATEALLTLGAAIAKLELIQGDVVVNALPGDHDLSESAIKFASAVKDRTITLQGSGVDTTRLLGGKIFAHRALDETTDANVWNLIPVAARSSVRVADLSSITSLLGKTQAMSSVEGEPKVFVPGIDEESELFPAEPFLNGFPLTTAQWPDRDDPDIALSNNQTTFRFTRVMGAEDETYSPTATVDGMRHYRFPFMQGSAYGTGAAPFASWTDFDDCVALGFWSVDWFSSFVKVKKSSSNVNGLQALEIEIPDAFTNEDGLGDVVAGARFALLNSFHALNAAGEYVLKRSNIASSSTTPAAVSSLYFIPPHSMTSNVDSAELLVSTQASAMIELSGQSKIKLVGFSLEATRGTAVTGSDLPSGTEITNLHINNIGMKGIEISGIMITVQNIACGHIGGKAISMSGGVPKTLVSAGNVVAFNTIHHSPRRSLHYGECLDIAGVGVIVHDNLIYSSPTAVIEIGGNDHVFEFNEIHHVALDAFDTGAVHWAAFDPTKTGYTFRHNFIHHIGFKDASPCSSMTSCLLAGIYMDDGSFGTSCYGNVFWMPQPDRTTTTAMGDAVWFSDEVKVMAMFENGGSRNVIENNFVLDTQHVFGSSGGFINNDGEMGASRNQIPTGSAFWANMLEFKYQIPPWSTHYPWMAAMLVEVPDNCPTNPKCPAAPFGDTVRGNVAIDVGKSFVWTEKVAKWDDDSGEEEYNFAVDFEWQGMDTNVERVSTSCLEAGTTGGTLNPSKTTIPNSNWDEDTCTLQLEVDQVCRCCAGDGSRMLRALVMMESDGSTSVKTKKMSRVDVTGYDNCDLSKCKACNDDGSDDGGSNDGDDDGDDGSNDSTTTPTPTPTPSSDNKKKSLENNGRSARTACWQLHVLGVTACTAWLIYEKVLWK